MLLNLLNKKENKIKQEFSVEWQQFREMHSEETDPTAGPGHSNPQGFASKIANAEEDLKCVEKGWPCHFGVNIQTLTETIRSSDHPCRATNKWDLHDFEDATNRSKSQVKAKAQSLVYKCELVGFFGCLPVYSVYACSITQLAKGRQEIQANPAQNDVWVSCCLSLWLMAHEYKRQ